RVDGDANHIQARRYAQGTGVHTAVGAMVLQGNDNHQINWGVGPAYGWDYSVGGYSLEGDSNTLQTDWSPGHGDVNGHALAWIRGNSNRLMLPGFGSGAFVRNAASYGLAAVSGRDNRLKYESLAGPYERPFTLTWNSWGVWKTEGANTVDPALRPETV